MAVEALQSAPDPNHRLDLRYAEVASIKAVAATLAVGSLIDSVGVQLFLDAPMFNQSVQFDSGLADISISYAHNVIANQTTIVRGHRARPQLSAIHTNFAPNALALVDAHEPYESENYCKTPQFVDGLYVSPCWLKSVAEQMCENNVGTLKVRSDLFVADPVLKGVVQQFAGLHRHAAPQIDIDYTRHLLAVTLLTRHTSGVPSRRVRARPLAHVTLQKVVEFVDAGIASKLGLGELAHIARMSEHQFLRCFSLATGMTPHQFVLEKRIAHAERLLRLTAAPIAQVAMEAGFHSQAHLSQVFRARRGTTPGTIRRQQ
jgi:AraC family transcriptional regulator